MGGGGGVFPVSTGMGRRVEREAEVAAERGSEEDNGCGRDRHSARGCGCAAPPWHGIWGQTCRIKYNHASILQVAKVRQL